MVGSLVGVQEAASQRRQVASPFWNQRGEHRSQEHQVRGSVDASLSVCADSGFLQWLFNGRWFEM